MFKPSLFGALLIFSASLPTAAFSGQIVVKPGLWQVRTETTVDGMPEGLPPVSRTQELCFTKDMLATYQHLHLLSGAFGECVMLENEEVEKYGNTHAMWKMRCRQPHQTVKASGDLMSISSQHYMGDIRFQSEDKPMKGKVRFNGKRKGECNLHSNQPVKPQGNGS